MIPILAHIESLSGSTLTSSGVLMGNQLVTAPCAFHDNPFLSWRLFLENKEVLGMLYMSGTLAIALLFLLMFLLLFLRRRKKQVIGILLLIFIVFMGVFVLRFLEGERASFGKTDSNHVHADINLWILGEKMFLGKGEYISSEDSLLSNYAHIHDSLGSVMHVHATGVTYGYAFETLGITFNETCLSLDKEKKSYCTDGEHALTFYLNDKPVKDVRSHVINDLDKLSIIYDKKTVDIQTLHNESSDNACLYSGKCLERANQKEQLGCSGE